MKESIRTYVLVKINDSRPSYAVAALRRGILTEPCDPKLEQFLGWTLKAVRQQYGFESVHQWQAVVEEP